MGESPSELKYFLWLQLNVVLGAGSVLLALGGYPVHVLAAWMLVLAARLLWLSLRGGVDVFRVSNRVAFALTAGLFVALILLLVAGGGGLTDWFSD